MCAAAVIWSGIKEISYGYSIKEAIEQGRERINISCREIFERAGKSIAIQEGLLHDRCSALYDRSVRDQITRLQDADERAICLLNRSAEPLRFASHNFCPTLEACRILGLDTSVVCKILIEELPSEFCAKCIHLK